MLNKLVELADRDGLVESEDLEKKRVDFEIQIGRDGRVQELINLRGKAGKGLPMLVPRLPQRTLAVSAGLLVDNAKYVLGIGDGMRDRADRLLSCRKAFVARIAEASARTNEPALKPVLAFYENLVENLGAILAARPSKEWSGSEVLIFSLPELGRVHERPAIRAFLNHCSMQDSSGASRHKARCLVTGNVGFVQRLHPMLKRVPRARTSGAALVSFNAPAFESYGLKQGENAPVSRSATIAYATSLNWLLERSGDRRHRHGVAIGEDAVAVYWTTAPASTLEVVGDLSEGSPKEQAEAFFESPWKGQPAADFDRHPFYAATLSGNAARVVVRDWFEASLGKVKSNLRQYFEDLGVGIIARPLPIWQLLAAVALPGRLAPAPDLSARIIAFSLKGTPLPRDLLRQALLRMRATLTEQPATLRARVALIKAVLIGIGRAHRNKSHLTEVTVSLDEQSTQTAYNLGRLFAALERAQQNALGDLNATIRDRYFSAASSTPSLVFARLIRTAQHHISKARSEGRDFGIEKLISQIVERFSSKGFPGRLGLEDQGLFAVGYYHQREAFFAKRRDPRDGAIHRQEE